MTEKNPTSPDPHSRRSPLPCDTDDPDCATIGQGSADRFLQQALGSPGGDMRLPSLLLVIAAFVAVLAVFLRRRRRHRRGGPAEGQAPRAGTSSTK